MTTLAAISFWQPWGSLLLLPAGDPAKVNETRNYAAPPRVIGRRIAIHAAGQPIVEAKLSPPLRELCREVFGSAFATTLPRGAIIGTAVLAESRRMGSDPTPTHLRDDICGWWEPGRWAWRMADPRVLTPVLPLRGQRSWFTVELEHL